MQLEKYTESSVLQRDSFILGFLPCFMDVTIFLFSSLGGTKLCKKRAENRKYKQKVDALYYSCNIFH